uniref:Uncharacterized protein n=1 Tax=Romanomermis culicivorax TaxID=13658 RepID=A0A915K3E0_ROMCU
LLKYHLPIKGILPPLLYLSLAAVEKNQLRTDHLPEILRSQLEYDLEICAQCKSIIIPHQMNIFGFAFLNGQEFSISYVSSGSFPVRKVYCLKCNGDWSILRT